MNAVPTTPTYTDSLKEHKDLKDEIASLKQIKTALKGECETYAQTKTGILEELRQHGCIPSLQDEVLQNIKSNLQASIDKKREEEANLNVSVGSLLTSKTALKSEVDALKVETLSYTTSNGSMKQEIETLTESLNQLKRDSSKSQLEEQQKLKDILDKKKAAEDRLAEVNKDYDTKMQSLSEGERRNSEKSQDLAIYERRLRKACLELYPEMEIILINYD